jgi:Icc-related predicted phosphoesterase
MVAEIESNANNFLIVPGNCDLPETSALFEHLGVSIHGIGRIIGEVGFFGVGGSNITPFNTPLEFQEHEIKNILKSGYDLVKEARVKILVSHAPPINTLDKTSKGYSGGSKAVREFVEENDIDLVVCGHIHECRGSTKIGKTQVINTGPARMGYVELIALEDGTISYEFQTF